MLGGYEGGHVECSANARSPSADHALAAELATIAIDRSKARQSSDLLSIEFSKLRELSEKCMSSDCRDSFHVIEDFGFGLQLRISGHDLRQLFVKFRFLLGIKINGGLDQLTHTRVASLLQA